MTIPARLNHYTILGELGKGGMGEVYLAEDTRLHRRIAIKVLSPAMASDPERRQRFEREAQAIAALNHPNIVTIYSVEEADGLPFLTMELVEGRPLSEWIPAGGLPLDMLLRVGVSVSDAIAAAHQRGITHRDLKPANVLITPEGRAKVLDFGLAKLREAELDADGLTRMPSGDLTGEGRIIGTVAYMSPEQAEGKTVDPRSDIFSLGVMLHEMSTGERPFKGDTNVSVLSSILKDAPVSITDINPRLPAGLGRIVRRSLAKDPSRRYQTATDLRNELEELKQELDSGITVSMPSSSPVPATRSRGRTMALGGAVAIAVVLAAVFAARQLRTPRQAGAAALFDAGRFTRLTNTGNAFMAAVSPDGRYVTHVKNTGAMPALWMRQSATMSDVQIVPPAQVRYDGVNYSPDGDYVYYVTYAPTGGVGTLFRVTALGGQPQRILEDIDSHISFSPDRRQMTFIRGVPTDGRNYVMIANADGTAARRLATVDPPDQLQLSSPAWSPDGATIIQSGLSLREGPHAAIFAIDVKSGTASRVGGRWNYTGDMEWMPDGRAFLIAATEVGTAATQVWQVAFPSGERHRVTNDLNNYVGVSLSADARTIVTVQTENLSNLWVTPAADPAHPAQITLGRGRGDGLSGLAWAPAGRIVYGSVASGRPEIWIMHADGSDARQLTNDTAPSVQPAVSPDGKYIVFQRFTPKGICLWRMSLE
ncbi:MAG: protein kinase, partial [Acidobacteriota bacterium]